ncbi:MAG: hypothetical protein QM725_06420 [Lacibacter sp.]
MKTLLKQLKRKVSVNLIVTGIIVVIISFTINSCKHQIPVTDTNNPGGLTGTPGSTGRTCSTDSVYFANEIFPLVSSTCAMSGCHDAVTHKDGVNLTTYANIMKYVVPGNASNSKLYKEIVKTGSERMPPPPMAAWTSDQVAKLAKWINQGAANNVCDKCDTTDYKYSTAIKTIMQNKCQGCHNPALLGGNIDLSTYTGVKASIANGKLYGSITWASGFSGMPKGGVKMPDCQIVQIKKWIDAGSPNN